MNRKFYIFYIVDHKLWKRNAANNVLTLICLLSHDSFGLLDTNIVLILIFDTKNNRELKRI
jgi:hypothetical protein